jgi:hypothetical protein
MLTFDQFMENKNIEPQFDEAVELLASMEVDPFEWVLEYAKYYDPLLEAIMLEELNVYSELAPPPVVQAPQITPVRGYQAPTLGGVAKQVGGAIGNFIAGPGRKYQVASLALNWLNNSIKKIDPEDRRFRTTANRPLGNWLQNVVQELQKQAGRIPNEIKQYEKQVANAPYDPNSATRFLKPKYRKTMPVPYNQGAAPRPAGPRPMAQPAAPADLSTSVAYA